MAAPLWALIPVGMEYHPPEVAFPTIALVSTPHPAEDLVSDGLPRDCSPIPLARLRGFIERIALEEGLDPQLVTLVIERESGFRPCAVSVEGALGLMQLMPETAADLGVADPFDAQENVAAGAKILGRLLRRYEGDLTLALAAYHAGPGAVDRHGGLPPFPDTLRYVESITTSLTSPPATTSEGTDSQAEPTV